MADFTDNEDLDAKKKALEIKKLEKEISKLEREGTELSWRKWSNWGAAIIAVCSVALVGLNGYLTSEKSKLVAEETKNQQAQNDTSRAIFRRDSLILISQKNKIQKQLDSLSQKFIQDKTRFDKERARFNYIISQKENKIGGLSKQKDSLSQNNTKLIDCYSRASDFIKTYCIKDDKTPYEEVWAEKPRPFFHRFSKSFEEIAETNFSSMNFQQFLIGFAGYKINSDKPIEMDRFILSGDGKMKIDIAFTQGHYRKKLMFDLHDKLKGQFDCWKKLSKNERLQLLNQSVNRTR